MAQQDVTTAIEIIRQALAAMALPDVVVGLEKEDDEGVTFVVGDKELVLARELVEDDARLRAEIDALLRTTLTPPA